MCVPMHDAHEWVPPLESRQHCHLHLSGLPSLLHQQCSWHPNALLGNLATVLLFLKTNLSMASEGTMELIPVHIEGHNTICASVAITKQEDQKWQEHHLNFLVI